MPSNQPVGSPDTRAKANRILGQMDRTVLQSIIKFTIGIALGAAVYLIPSFEGLDQAAHATLAILVSAAFLWISEAIPAFAVAVLVIAAEIAILGAPDGVWQPEGIDPAKKWTTFVSSWSSSLMWLFLGGFVLAHAATKTKLDQWMAGHILGVCGKSPAMLLAGAMAVTFVFSMFMSNTATAAMMITVAAPMMNRVPKGHPFIKAFLLSIPIAANLGGIGTIIGTPPNAIAVKALSEDVRPDFLGWMKLGLPPALALATIAFFMLLFMSKKGSNGEKLNLSGGVATDDTPMTGKEKAQRWFVIAIFTTTVGMWMTQKLHGYSPSVVSFLPIAAFAVTGVLTSKDMRELPWDVLLLLAGGMSLGVAVEKTGLAQWIGEQVPGSWPLLGLIIAMALLGVIMSNLMSNTATASILLPITMGLVAGQAAENQILVGVPLAIACSCAMCLPISTPPNAVTFATGKIKASDFMVPGLIMSVLGPAIAILWIQLVG
ncbi:SLC13 family permease [Sulfuriroseicoccus oceanibius]|uniref:SLC13/DASS family transporter n=1 Tax=Sulfuriroseicoccus oceanibius TaxID=2707525 RepID=A0A7T7F378_9BACT|nr:DASS family sodium-coupled anion symporter [Sulfuriroseicoccus oceanibius]QQL45853.1 SLC13/DASS family transporter [Sulfuriroseicoccus oceanibius]